MCRTHSLWEVGERESSHDLKPAQGSSWLKGAFNQSHSRQDRTGWPGRVWLVRRQQRRERLLAAGGSCLGSSPWHRDRPRAHRREPRCPRRCGPHLPASTAGVSAGLLATRAPSRSAMIDNWTLGGRSGSSTPGPYLGFLPWPRPEPPFFFLPPPGGASGGAAALRFGGIVDCPIAFYHSTSF